jgi:hypothetical protein
VVVAAVRKQVTRLVLAVPAAVATVQITPLPLVLAPLTPALVAVAAAGLAEGLVPSVALAVPVLSS